MAVSRSRLRPGSTVDVVGQHVGDLALDRIPGAERLTPASRLLQHHVHRDPVQPRPERAARLEARQVAPRLHEGFLRAVFGRRDVAGHAQAQRVDARRMPAVELLEGGGRTVGRGRDQPALLGRLAHALQFIDDLPGVCQDPPRCYPSHRAAGSGILHRPPGGPCRAPVTDQMRQHGQKVYPGEPPCLTAVRVERTGPVGTVILHRPAVRNAVDPPTAAALARPAWPSTPTRRSGPWCCGARAARSAPAPTWAPWPGWDPVQAAAHRPAQPDDALGPDGCVAAGTAASR